MAMWLAVACSAACNSPPPDRTDRQSSRSSDTGDLQAPHATPDTGSTRPTCVSVEPAPVTADGWGELRLGMAMADIPGACPLARETTFTMSGMPLRGYTASAFGAKVSLLPDHEHMMPERLGSIRIEGGRIRTVHGFGKGTRFVDIRLMLGAPALAFACGDRVDAVQYQLHEGMSFQFSDRRCTRPGRPRQLPVDSVPDSSRVIAIDVYLLLDEPPDRTAPPVPPRRT